ncbi:hypothetical protein [Methanolobus psychrotolerans]|uniref:hypothetical protein n=1 Tax=Methanolobus psychrotolerans TaxID=1874706 RepID=UPI000B916690|nr:hypothetical protein [Methanolobus psychrotolerans]
MKAKILTIFLILLSFSVIGCVDDNEDMANETDMSNTTTEDVGNETVPDDIEMDETVGEEVEATEEDENKPLEIIESEDPRTYTIYMKNYLVQPNNITINTEDTIVWFNDNNPARLFTLVSNEGLWENQNIANRYSFKYTFNETGTYTYKVLGFEDRMKGTIIVK